MGFLFVLGLLLIVVSETLEDIQEEKEDNEQ